MLLDDASKRALSAAVKAVESRTSAEIVLSVRPRSGAYLHADLLVAAGSATVVLAFMLFSPFEFGLVWFVVDPIVVGTAAALACTRLPPLRRLLTPRSWMKKLVREAACAAFLERRVHTTSRRTGVLIYVSLLERAVEAVVDLAVEPVAQRQEWRAALERVEGAVMRGASGAEVARAIEGLAEVLGSSLPRETDDVNELPDEVAVS